MDTFCICRCFKCCINFLYFSIIRKYYNTIKWILFILIIQCILHSCVFMTIALLVICGFSDNSMGQNSQNGFPVWKLYENNNFVHSCILLWKFLGHDNKNSKSKSKNLLKKQKLNKPLQNDQNMITTQKKKKIYQIVRARN